MFDDSSTHFSQRYIINQSKKVRDYSQLEDSIIEAINQETFETLWTNKDKDIFEFAKSVIESVNLEGPEDFSMPSLNMSLFLQWSSTLLPKKTKTVLSQTWPPVFHKTIPNIESYIHLLLWMIKEASSPEKLIKWLTFGMPSIKLQKGSISSNSIILASSFANSKQKDGRPLWAVLTSDHDFLLYRRSLKEIAQVAQVKASGVSFSNNRVIINGQNGEEVAAFEPVDPRIATLWTQVFEKKPPSYVMFLNSFDPVCPSIIYKGYLSSLTSFDGIMIRSLISPGLFPDMYQLINNLYDVFTYSRQVNHFIGVIVADNFEDPELMIDNVIKHDSPLGNLCKVYFERFGAKYSSIFLPKLISYVGNHEEDLFSGNDQSSQSEIVFFTVLKYILNSLPFIKREIKHLASFLRAYSLVMNNSQGFVVSVLSQFFGIGYICSVFENPKLYFPSLSIPNIRNVTNISNYLKVVFSMKLFSNEPFSKWNMRLEKHVYPKLEEFLISIADIGRISPKYEIPSEDSFLKAITFLMLKNAENHSLFLKAIENIKHSKKKHNSIYCWNLSIAISNFFKHSFDNNEIHESMRGKRTIPESNETVLPTADNQESQIQQ